LQTTPIETALRFEAQVARVDRRKSFVTARMMAGDALTAEAEAVFVALAPDTMRNAIAARTKG
jgi:acyl-CoA thioesterase FadM